MMSAPVVDAMVQKTENGVTTVNRVKAMNHATTAKLMQENRLTGVAIIGPEQVAAPVSSVLDLDLLSTPELEALHALQLKAARKA
ncbi:MAG: hypothetical protein NVS1B11_36350 [Terriglobales bacterium]